MQIQSAYYKPKKKKKNLKPFLWIITSLLVMLGLIYLALFLPFLKIRKVEANGTEKIPSFEIINSVERYLAGFQLIKIPKSNYFLLSEKKLAEYLKNAFPGLKEVLVIKKFPPNLIISAKDRQKTIVYCGQVQCFYLDEDGVSFEPAPAIFGGLNSALKDNSGREAKFGDKMIEPALINFMLAAQKLINDDSNINLVNFEIDNYPTIDLNAKTSEDWKIMFDINIDPLSQVSALKKILGDKIKDQRGQLEYIDLRIGNRVYYKMKQ